jgi:hypothetical protein
MEAPTPLSPLRRSSPWWTSLAAVGLFLVALVAITSVALDDQIFNFARDLSAAVPTLLLLAAAVWLWPRPESQLGRLARAVVLVGLALFGLGYGLEAIGIWGWSWNGAGRYVVTDQGLAQTWEFGHSGTALGELALVVGVVLAMATVVQRRRLTDRRGHIDRGTATSSLGMSEPKWGEPGYRPPPWLVQPRPEPSPGQQWALWAALILALVGQAAYLWSYFSIDTPYDSSGCPVGPLFANPWVAGAGVLIGLAALVLAAVVTLGARAPVSRLVPQLGRVVVALTAVNLGLFVLWPLGATCW